MKKQQLIDLLEKYPEDAELVFVCKSGLVEGENILALYSIEEEVMDLKRLYFNLTV